MRNSIYSRYFSSSIGIIGWTIFYGLINFIALFAALNKNSLLGDMDGLAYSTNYLLLISALAIVLALVFYFYLFKLASKIRTFYIADYAGSNLASFTVGLYLQAFIVYVHFTGGFIAASDVRGGDALSALFAIISPDAIFLVYFASRRNRSYLNPVLFLWIFSSLQRGWIGLIFALIAIKAFELVRARKIKFKHVLYLVIIIAIYPFFDIIKLFVRVSGGFNVVDMYNNFTDTVNLIEINYTNTLLIGAEKIIGRIQLFSHVTYIIDNMNYFDSLVSSGQLVPFWKEGIYGIAWDRLHGVNHVMEVPRALAALIDPYNTSSWNVNPSIVGWIIIYSEFLPVVIFYICALVIGFVLISRSISKDPVFIDFVYFLLSTFLLPGWISQLITFANAFLIYLIISIIFKLSMNLYYTKSFHNRTEV